MKGSYFYLHDILFLEQTIIKLLSRCLQGVSLSFYPDLSPAPFTVLVNSTPFCLETFFAIINSSSPTDMSKEYRY